MAQARAQIHRVTALARPLYRQQIRNVSRSLEDERANLDIACKICELRTKAGLEPARACQADRHVGRQHLPAGERRLPGPFALDVGPDRRLEMRVDVRFVPIGRK